MRLLLSFLLGKLPLAALGWSFGGGGVEVVGDQDVVFGLQLTLTGAHCAASFPNGTTAGLASIKGDAAYVKLMQEWFNIATSRNGHVRSKDLYPLPSHFVGKSEYINQEIHFSNPWWVDRMWRKMPEAVDWIPHEPVLEDFHHDASTAILESNILRLRDQCFEAVNKDAETFLLDKPHAEVVLPTWLYKDLPLYDHDALKEYAHKDFANETHTSSTPFCSLTSRVSAAVQRAGFGRSTFQTASDTKFARDYGGAWLMGPPNSAYTTAIMAVKGLESMGTSETRYSAAVFVVDIESVGSLRTASVWVSPILKRPGAPRLQVEDAASRSTLAKDTANSHDVMIPDESLEVLDMILPAVLEAQDDFNCPASMIILTGSGVPRGLNRVLREEVASRCYSSSIILPPTDSLLTAVGAAELAREELHMSRHWASRRKKYANGCGPGCRYQHGEL